MLQGLTGWHLIILLAVILLLFGAAKLPALAKSMGQSARVFKGEMKAMKEDDAVRAEQTAVDPTTGLVDPSVGGTVTGQGSKSDPDRTI